MDQTQQFQDMVHTMLRVYAVIIPIFYIVKVTLYAIPMWRIAKRAGISPQLSLLCAIPLVGRLITTYILAFSDWRLVPSASTYPYPPPPAYPPAGYPPQGPTA